MSDPDPDSLRVSDEERDAVAAQLQDSLDAGRIDLSEFDERTRAAYDAATYGELNRLLTDLPGAVPAVPPRTDGRSSPTTSGMAAKPSNDLGTGALVCGVMSVVAFFPFSILAIVLGAIGIGKANKGSGHDKSRAIAGLILGSVSLPVWATFVTLSSTLWWG